MWRSYLLVGAVVFVNVSGFGWVAGFMAGVVATDLAFAAIRRWER